MFVVPVYFSDTGIPQNLEQDTLHPVGIDA